SEYQESTYRSLEKYAVNLNDRYMQGKLGTVIGRQDEIQDLRRILSRKEKNNAILVGNSGVGKTSIVEGLVAGIVNGDIKGKFKKKINYNLDISAIRAWDQYGSIYDETVQS